MKKGDRVYICEKAKKPQSRLYSWTENNLFGKITLPAGTVLYHVSCWHKIKAFAPVVTCFSTLPDPMGDYIYMAILKKPLEFERYDLEDYRLDLGKVSNDDIEIIYLGTATSHEKIVVDKYGRKVLAPVKYKFAKSFKELEKELNKMQLEKAAALVKEKEYLGYRWGTLKEWLKRE